MKLKGGRRRAGDDGFNLVVLAVMFTVMNILVAKALPLWSTQIQREKEEELIFRGLQYAEAIRVFRLRFNRAPVRLQELIEVEPRCIRQLWNNPLSREAAGRPPAAIGWEPIFEGQPDQPNPSNRQGGQGPGLQPAEPRDLGGQRLGPLGQPIEEEEVRIGPILGVRSKVGETAIKLFFDSDGVQEWRFTPDVLQPRPLVGGGPTPMPLNASLIGRPWPPGVNPPIAARPSSPGQRRQRIGSGLRQQGQPVGSPQPGAPPRGQVLNPPGGGRQRQ